MSALESLDLHDARYVGSAAGALRAFNEAGVLAAADVHVALRLARFFGEDDDDTLLAAALAVRAPRLSSVCVDLTTVADTAAGDLEATVDLAALPWPEPEQWLEGLTSSPLVAVGEEGGEERPLRLVGATLYLDRYWQDERSVAADLLARSEAADDVDDVVLADGLARLFDDEEPDLQRLAAATCVLRRLAVVGGGPGTGKTTTVTRILVLLDEQAAAGGRPAPIVALAAPTGKAAARLAEAVHGEASDLGLDQSELTRLLDTSAFTIHRLLGSRPGSDTRFRHDARNQLPHDVVIVDESSMVSLSLMARLLEAVRSDARLIFVGDPKQLASVEAGAVLGDLVGPAADGLLMHEEAQSRLADVAGRRYLRQRRRAARQSVTASSFYGESTASPARSPSWPRPSAAATPGRAGRAARRPRRRPVDRRRRRGARSPRGPYSGARDRRRSRSSDR